MIHLAFWCHCLWKTFLNRWFQCSNSCLTNNVNMSFNFLTIWPFSFWHLKQLNTLLRADIPSLLTLTYWRAIVPVCFCICTQSALESKADIHLNDRKECKWLRNVNYLESCIQSSSWTSSVEIQGRLAVNLSNRTNRWSFQLGKVKQTVVQIFVLVSLKTPI